MPIRLTVLVMKKIWFRDARIKAGFTQESLAASLAKHHLPKHQAYIAKLENGVIVEPGFSVGLALATELGVNPYALQFGRREDVA